MKEIERRGQELSSITGYDPSAIQMLGHDASGKCVWLTLDTTPCEPIIPLNEVVGPSTPAKVTGGYTVPVYPVEAE